MTGDQAALQRARSLALQAIEEELRRRDPPRPAPKKLMRYHLWAAPAGVEPVFDAFGARCLCGYCFHPEEKKRRRPRWHAEQLDLFGAKLVELR